MRPTGTDPKSDRAGKGAVTEHLIAASRAFVMPGSGSVSLVSGPGDHPGEPPNTVRHFWILATVVAAVVLIAIMVLGIVPWRPKLNVSGDVTASAISISSLVNLDDDLDLPLNPSLVRMAGVEKMNVGPGTGPVELRVSGLLTLTHLHVPAGGTLRLATTGRSALQILLTAAPRVPVAKASAGADASAASAPASLEFQAAQKPAMTHAVPTAITAPGDAGSLRITAGSVAKTYPLDDDPTVITAASAQPLVPLRVEMRTPSTEDQDSEPFALDASKVTMLRFGTPDAAPDSKWPFLSTIRSGTVTLINTETSYPQAPGSMLALGDGSDLAVHISRENGEFHVQFSGKVATLHIGLPGYPETVSPSVLDILWHSAGATRAANIFTAAAGVLGGLASLAVLSWSALRRRS